MTTSARGRKIVIILGAPESGKTTLARHLLASLQADNTDKRFVAIIDPGGQFRGGFMPPGNDIEGWLAAMKGATPKDPAKVRAILFDDGDGYLSPMPPKQSAERDLYLRHRWWRTDVMVTARRAQNLCPTLWSAAEMVYLFRTNPADRSARKRLDEFAPGIQIPTEPFVFVSRNLYTGEEHTWRTLAKGGIEAVK